MSTPEWIVLAWMVSIPVWLFLFFAYKFRHVRNRFRYFLWHGISLLGGAGCLVASLVWDYDVLTWAAGLFYWGGWFIALHYLRKAVKSEAANPEEAAARQRIEDKIFQ